MVERKGQITVFIILGVIILLSFTLVAIIKSGLVKKLGEPPIDETEFQEYFNFFDLCLQEKAESSIRELALNGGYYGDPPRSIRIILFDYPYYLYENKSYFPKKTQIEEELSKMFMDLSEECYKDLLDLIDKKYSVEKGKVKSTSTITTDSVVFDITYPITIGREDKKQSKLYYRIEIPVRLGEIYNALDEFITLEKENPESLCLTCLADVADKYNLQINLEIFNGTTMIFSFAQNRTDYYLNWMFVNKY